MENQIRYCKGKQIPMFAPLDGICFVCGRLIQDTNKEHITNCPYCNRSFCD